MRIYASLTQAIIGAKPFWTHARIFSIDPREQTSMKCLSKFMHFRSRECIWKCCLPNGSHLYLPQYDKVACYMINNLNYEKHSHRMEWDGHIYRLPRIGKNTEIHTVRLFGVLIYQNMPPFIILRRYVFSYCAPLKPQMVTISHKHNTSCITLGKLFQ